MVLSQVQTSDLYTWFYHYSLSISWALARVNPCHAKEIRKPVILADECFATMTAMYEKTALCMHVCHISIPHLITSFQIYHCTIHSRNSSYMSVCIYVFSNWNYQNNNHVFKMWTLLFKHNSLWCFNSYQKSVKVSDKISVCCF